MKRIILAIAIASMLIIASAQPNGSTWTNPPDGTGMSSVSSVTNGWVWRFYTNGGIASLTQATNQAGIAVVYQFAPLPSNIKAGIMRLVSDILDSINLSGFIATLGGLWGAARVLRKVLPDKMQTNNFGQLLAHLALEVNPSLNAPPQLTAEDAVARAKAQLAVIPPISPTNPPGDAPKT